MNNDPSFGNPIEQALDELESAGRARLFEPTPVSAADLLARSSGCATRPALRRSRFGVPLAVAATITLVVWSGLFFREVQSVRSRAAAAPFSNCLTGPGQSMPLPCHFHDQDADGDVDLADFSRTQLADARVSR
jgi:hypothetical protein